MLDMIEEIDHALERAGLGGVTIVVVGPLADASLSYANICGEWCELVTLFLCLVACRLSSPRRDKIYIPEDPFRFPAMQATRRLRVCTELNAQFVAATKDPCVVLWPASWLFTAMLKWFLDIWKDDPSVVVCNIGACEWAFKSS